MSLQTPRYSSRPDKERPLEDDIARMHKLEQRLTHYCRPWERQKISDAENEGSGNPNSSRSQLTHDSPYQAQKTRTYGPLRIAKSWGSREADVHVHEPYRWAAEGSR